MQPLPSALPAGTSPRTRRRAVSAARSGSQDNPQVCVGDRGGSARELARVDPCARPAPRRCARRSSARPPPSARGPDRTAGGRKAPVRQVDPPPNGRGLLGLQAAAGQRGGGCPGGGLGSGGSAGVGSAGPSRCWSRNAWPVPRPRCPRRRSPPRPPVPTEHPGFNATQTPAVGGAQRSDGACAGHRPRQTRPRGRPSRRRMTRRLRPRPRRRATWVRRPPRASTRPPSSPP